MGEIRHPQSSRRPTHDWDWVEGAYLANPPAIRTGEELQAAGNHVSFHTEQSFDVVMRGLVSEFTFPVSPDAREYCERIPDELVRLFGVSRSDALDRMNRHWADQSMVTPKELASLRRELPEFWAKQIYYGPNVYWWLDEQAPRSQS